MLKEKPLLANETVFVYGSHLNIESSKSVTNEENNDIKTTENAAKDKLITEKLLNTIIITLLSNLSMANASLLQTAIKATFYQSRFGDINSLSNSWIYFAIIFSITICLPIIPIYFTEKCKQKKTIKIN